MVFLKCADPLRGVTADIEQKKKKTIESGCLVYDFLQSPAASCYVTATTATPQRKITEWFCPPDKEYCSFFVRKRPSNCKALEKTKCLL